jgi:hypothetical protein
MQDSDNDVSPQHERHTVRHDAPEYHSALDDNRRTTQQVLVPRRSGVHAVMQRGPRLALIGGAVIAVSLLLVSLMGTPDATGATGDTVPTLPTLTPSTAVALVGRVVVTGTGESGLYLRSAPGRDATIVLTIPEGARLDVTGARTTTDGNWLPVQTADGVSGWVAADYTREE